ncbi:MAG: hypothetical protein Kow0026_21160 [Oricola sp.]
MRTTVSSALACAILLAGPAAARDRFVGEWSGDCGGAVQCWVSVAGDAGAYKVDFIVADRMNAQDVKCRVSGRFSRGPVRYGPHETFDDALMGTLNGSHFYVAPLTGGSIIVGGGLTAGLACGEHVMQQVYYPIGD